jgi:ATP-dependent exoDNAse (exonuclease V) alpha subunit
MFTYNQVTKEMESPDGLISFAYSEFKKLQRQANFQSPEFGYVVNSHKVQGGSYSNVIVDETNILNQSNINLPNKSANKSMYTALSRVRKNLYIYNVENSKSPTIRDVSNIDNPLNEH